MDSFPFRWGPKGATDFKDNLLKLARLFKSSLPKSTLVVWASALPTSPAMKSSLLIKQLDFLQHTLRFEVLEANTYARQTMVAHGFDVLDYHFFMRMQMHRRKPDGVHYAPVAIRFLTNLFLTHIALSWDSPLPNRVNTILLDKAIAKDAPQSSSVNIKLESPQLLVKAKKQKNPEATASETKGSKKTSAGKKQNGARVGMKSHRQVRPYQREPLQQQRRGKVKRVGGGRARWAADKDNHQRPGWSQRRGSKSKGESGQRNWGSPRYTRDNNGRNWSSSSSSSQIQPCSVWITPPQVVQYQQPLETNWSEDHWPEEQQFANEPRYPVERQFNGDERYMGGQRFQEESRYTNEHNGGPGFFARRGNDSNTFNTLRRRQMLSTRYPFY